ncbi:hypothetical protein T492DRAFT_131755 [Pavlovales sp. CCMP2436]|nr:hypothetical protein T492DRAFT_131755 [Pavlovales sp. CCMP2436]
MVSLKRIFVCLHKKKKNRFIIGRPELMESLERLSDGATFARRYKQLGNQVHTHPRGMGGGREREKRKRIFLLSFLFIGSFKDGAAFARRYKQLGNQVPTHTHRQKMGGEKRNIFSIILFIGFLKDSIFRSTPQAARQPGTNAHTDTHTGREGGGHIFSLFLFMDGVDWERKHIFYNSDL